MDVLLENAQKICRAAGTSLANAVRIQQYHTDLRDFFPAYQVWERHLPGPLPAVFRGGSAVPAGAWRVRAARFVGLCAVSD
jgi:enamine deaminase RidA (YjgF/YER057c/UK114 family)